MQLISYGEGLISQGFDRWGCYCNGCNAFLVQTMQQMGQGFTVTM
jgi:hypothetical protein